jgi:hypothetical protein
MGQTRRFLRSLSEVEGNGGMGVCLNNQILSVPRLSSHGATKTTEEHILRVSVRGYALSRHG